MTDSAKLSRLTAITKAREEWLSNIEYVGSLLDGQSTKVTAKVLWMLGEMGLRHPENVAPYIGTIASFMESEEDLLRERSLNALGRIGRSDFQLIAPFFDNMFRLAEDNSPNVRLAFIWANENIATTSPDVYANRTAPFASLLDDPDTRVRLEAPEFFRVVGKRRPAFAAPFLDKLRQLAENDPDRVVRINALGAVNAIDDIVTKADFEKSECRIKKTIVIKQNYNQD